jgi:c-di-GMP-binding flagellar brake protein YcgR
MRNVSVAGAAIETEAAIPTGTSLTLVLRPASHIEAITIGEAIARSVRAGRLGVQFRHVEERERAGLQRLVYRPPRARRRHRV